MNPYVEKYIKISINLFLWAVALALFIFVLPKLLFLFLPFLIGWLIALIANPLVKFFENHLKLVRKHGSMIIIVTVLGLIITIIYLVIVRLSSEIRGFVAYFPELFKNISVDFNRIMDNFEKLYRTFPEPIQSSIEGFIVNVENTLPGIFQSWGSPTFEAAGNFAKNLPSIFVGILITILAAYFFLADREKINQFVSKIVPQRIQKSYNMYLSEVKTIIGGYFKAQFKIMMVVAVILLIGLMILKVRFALLFSILIALLDFLPFFGTGTVLIPWAVFSLLTNDYTAAFGLALIYAISQLVRHVIQPKILGDEIGLNPLIALIFMYIGYRIMGVGGLILSVPVGMLCINLNKHGFFDNLKLIFHEIVTDINNLRDLSKYRK